VVELLASELVARLKRGSRVYSHRHLATAPSGRQQHTARCLRRECTSGHRLPIPAAKLGNRGGLHFKRDDPDRFLERRRTDGSWAAGQFGSGRWPSTTMTLSGFLDVRARARR
jgi:hypothetical protein